MAAEYDNLLKYLAENHAEALASWLMGKPVGNRVRLIKTELSLQPVRADWMAQFDLEDEILHAEFETDPADSDPPLPLRMLDYFVRTYRRERKLVRQVVIVLAETTAHIPEEFRVGETRHRYRVIKMCEQDPEPLLAEPGLAPLAVLARTAHPEELIRQVADIVQNIPQPDLRSDLTAAAFLLAGLRFDRSFLRGLFKEEIMKHSSTYLDLVERSEARGEQRGIVQGVLGMLKELLKHHFGQLPEVVEERLAKLDAPTLIQLGVAQSDLSSLDELAAWIEQHKQSAHNGTVQNGAA